MKELIKCPRALFGGLGYMVYMFGCLNPNIDNSQFATLGYLSAALLTSKVGDLFSKKGV